MESEWIDPYRVGVNEKKRKKKLSTPQQWWEPTEREREKERMGGCLEVEVGAEAQGVQVAVEFGQVGAQQDVVGVVEGGHARLVQPVEGVQQRPVQQVGEAHERVGRLQVQQQRRRHERHALSQQKKNQKQLDGFVPGPIRWRFEKKKLLGALSLRCEHGNTFLAVF